MPKRPVLVTLVAKLEPKDLAILHRIVAQRRLGNNGYSAGLRLIIREWAAMQPAQLGYPGDAGDSQRPGRDGEQAVLE